MALKWYSFGHHANSIFAPASKSASDLDCLRGVRALMTLWVMAFHSLWFGGIFLTKKDFYEMLWYNPVMIPVMRGLSAVDVFFLLTGFLLAYPILTQQRPISLKDFWWRRWVRIVPAYFAAICIHCFILFSSNTVYPLRLLSTKGMESLVQRGNPEATDVPAGCEFSFINLLFLNNNLPFGGCMGWTWSLAVQAQFYFAFPLVLKYTGRGSKLVKFAFGSVVLALVLRVAAFYALKLGSYGDWPLHIFDSGDIDILFLLFFFWYMPFTIRVSTMFLGVVMAYLFVHKNGVEYMKKHPSLHLSLVALSITVFVASFVVRSANVLVLLNLYVAGPAFNASLFYLLFTLIHANELNDRLFSSVKSLLGWRGFYPISILSYGAYLIHPSIMQKTFSTVFYPVLPNYTFLISTTIVNLALSFAVAFVLYVFVQEPAVLLLKPSRFMTPAPKKTE